MAQFNQRDMDRAAVPVGRLNGRNVYRVPVLIRHNDSRACGTLLERRFTVMAHTAAEAANWARDHESKWIPETEIIAWGPKGGRVERYVGWFTAIAREINERVQPSLSL